jgi:hypothetical protein
MIDWLGHQMRSPRSIEFAFLLLILAGIVSSLLFLRMEGYLPPPFVYDPTDTMMDWFNTAYWAINGRVYDVWGSIYPPVSFVFLDIFSIHSCYGNNPFVGRDCDWVGRGTLLFFFGLNVVLTFKVFYIVDRRTALMRGAALAFGLPMIYTLERGNLIIPCYTVFVLGHGRILRSARLKWVAVALSINFKPYLLAAVLPHLLRRRWRWFEGCVVACLLVYFLSYAALGSGAPWQMASSMVAYLNNGGNSLFGALYYGASYSSILNYLHHGIPLMGIVGSTPIETIDSVLPVLMKIGDVGVVAALAVAALRPNTIPVHRLAALAVALVLTSTEFGGYAEVFLLFLVFQEPWRGPWRIAALVSAYLLCIPADYTLVRLAHQIEGSYLTGRIVGNDLSLTLGSLVRPGLVLIIQYALIAATLIDLLRAPRGGSVFLRRPAAVPAPDAA